MSEEYAVTRQGGEAAIGRGLIACGDPIVICGLLCRSGQPNGMSTSANEQPAMDLFWVQKGYHM